VPPLPLDRLDAPFAEPGTTISNGTADLLCLVSGLALVGLVPWMVIRRASARKAGRPESVGRHDPTDPWAAIPTDTMEADANSALVAADHALKTSDRGRGGFSTGFGWGGMTPGSFGGPDTRVRVRF
jgi:hypothetical protein